MQTEAYAIAKTLNTERNQRAVLRIVQGVSDFITDEEIASMMGQDPKKFERTVRLIIRDLRRQGHPIVSESGKGYRFPRSKDEVDATVADLRSRASDMRETAEAMEAGAYKMFAGQEQMSI